MKKRSALYYLLCTIFAAGFAVFVGMNLWHFAREARIHFTAGLLYFDVLPQDVPVQSVTTATEEEFSGKTLPEIPMSRMEFSQEKFDKILVKTSGSRQVVLKGISANPPRRAVTKINLKHLPNEEIAAPMLSEIDVDRGLMTLVFTNNSFALWLMCGVFAIMLCILLRITVYSGINSVRAFREAH